MMNALEKSYWSKIQNFQLDDPDSSFPFSHRLARENDWSLSFAQEAIEEYKKFTFLYCFSRHPVTPSDVVDQVWHLHMLYTYNYWEEFCDDVLERPLHHGPTKGGKEERNKYTDWYEQTKDSYKNYFGELPAHIWPSSEERFSEIDFRRVNTHRNYILSKKRFHWMAGSTLLLFISPLFMQASNSESSFVWFLLVMGFVIFATLLAKSGNKNGKGGGGTSSGSDSSFFMGCGNDDFGDSGCGSGCSGCGGCGG